jgi:hypothetical protein
MPERRRREEATERLTTPFPPMIREATLLNLPAISALDLARSSFFYFLKYYCCCQPIFTTYLVIFPSVCELTNFSNSKEVVSAYDSLLNDSVSDMCGVMFWARSPVAW